VVIMAGGAGTRFWPLSTAARPKQFLHLLGELSLLQQSYERALLLAPPDRILVLTNAALVPLVREQLPDLPARNVIGEPLRRDTAAAATLAALLARERYGDDTVLVTLTADHRIEPAEQFRRTLLSAVQAAGSGPYLYTFGIRPTEASSAYGYLRQGELLLDDEGICHYALDAFREKPDAATAQQYLAAGGYWWNSGMFVWSAATILRELHRHLPAHLEALEAAGRAEGRPWFQEALAEAFARLRPLSIDYGVMERAAGVRMVAAEFSWSDVGGWLALGEFLAADGQGNRHRGRLAGLEAAGNLVFCEDPNELVALVGVRDLVVVRAGDKTLVVEGSRAEEVKELVRLLEGADEGRQG